jgi:hypothetical protein
MGIMRAKYNTFLRGASAPLFLWAISGCIGSNYGKEEIMLSWPQNLVFESRNP